MLRNYLAHTMLVCVSSDIKIEVILCILCPRTDISADVQPIGVTFCMMVDVGPGQVFSPLSGTPPPPPKKNPEISVENISKTVSRSVTCQMGRNIGPRAFQKCIAWDGSPQGESPIRKMCIFGPGTDISGRST